MLASLVLSYCQVMMIFLILTTGIQCYLIPNTESLILLKVVIYYLWYNYFWRLCWYFCFCTIFHLNSFLIFGLNYILDILFKKIHLLFTMHTIKYVLGIFPTIMLPYIFLFNHLQFMLLHPWVISNIQYQLISIWR